MKLYCIHDREAGNYSTIMPQPNDVAAVRIFRVQVQRKEEGNMLNFAPEHFAMYRIGEFNDETGELKPELTKIVEAAALLTETR